MKREIRDAKSLKDWMNMKVKDKKEFTLNYNGIEY